MVIFFGLNQGKKRIHRAKENNTNIWQKRRKTFIRRYSERVEKEWDFHPGVFPIEHFKNIATDIPH